MQMTPVHDDAYYAVACQHLPNNLILFLTINTSLRWIIAQQANSLTRVFS